MVLTSATTKQSQDVNCHILPDSVLFAFLGFRLRHFSTLAV
jgi:hypothetical protein